MGVKARIGAQGLTPVGYLGSVESGSFKLGRSLKLS